MSRRSSYRSRRRRRKKSISKILVGLAIVAFFAFVYLLAQLSPGGSLPFLSEREPDADSPREDPMDSREYLQLAESTIATFEEEWTAGNRSMETIQVLEEGISHLQEHHRRTDRTDRETDHRIRELERRRDRLAGDLLFEEAYSLEQEGMALVDDDPERAGVLLQRSLDLLHRIRNDYSESPRNDPARINRIQRQIMQIEARPIYEQSLQYERRAEEEMEAGNHEAASQLFRLAARQQEDLNRTYPTIHLASARRLQDLLSRADDVMAVSIAGNLREIDEAVRGMNWDTQHEEIGELLVEAVRLQQRINEDHPRSSEASERRLERYQTLAQTARGTTPYNTILAEDEVLQSHLASGNFENLVGRLTQQVNRIEAFRANFPKAELPMESILRRTRFLYEKAPVLPDLWRSVEDDLLPIPGYSEGRMLRTEVPQWLYTTIVGENPSRSSGETLPVESVSFTDAEGFCLRLSWVMGRPARLPWVEEFRSALGSIDDFDMDAMAWTFDNTRGQIREVGVSIPNQHGFYDLIGNVGEWVRLSSPPEAAYLFGGSVRDSISAINVEEPVPMSRNERSRLIGFRVVVEDR